MLPTLAVVTAGVRPLSDVIVGGGVPGVTLRP
jgi:hypothetical protein